jgi:Ca2+-binding EF-hand superfamily protein
MANNIFTLDAMREEIEREFAPFQLDIDGKTLTLRNLLRVPKKDREQVYSLLDELSKVGDSDSDGSLTSTELSAQIALKIIPLVSDNTKLANLLVENIEDDLALTLRVFSSWMGATQAGEAERLDS